MTDAIRSRRQFGFIVHHVEDALALARFAFRRKMLAIVRDEIPDDGKLTAPRYARIRVKLDALMSQYYGAFPGDSDAIFYRLILDETSFARQYAIARERDRFVTYAEDHFDDDGNIRTERLLQSRL